jgi:hypothetical protein
MSRHALRSFFTRVLPIVLPLVGGCSSPVVNGCPPITPSTTERVIAISGDLAGLDDAGCATLCEQQGAFYAVNSCGPADGGAVDDSGANLIDCQGLSGPRTGCIGGRRPHGFAASENDQLARMAELEAASVFAFRILADELRVNGAPSSLIEAARRAARDEVRHARLMGTLAGTRPRMVKPIGRARSLEEIAVENVVEGCVRETFGAAVAQLEARAHPDARVREAMASIFPDEERHAELAHDVHAWLAPQLTSAARRRVERARRQALEELRAESPGLAPLVDALAAIG